MMIKQLALLSGVSVTALSVWAQDMHSVDTLVVTANRFQQPIHTVTAAMSVVTREDIDRWQSKTLVDVMRRLPGVDIGQNGGMGQKASLFLRGSNSNHALILVDGIRLNQAGISGSSDLSQFPISLVQRIEYIRGPRAAVYGSDAIGGVVNIITSSTEARTRLDVGVGSNGYQNYEAAHQQDVGDHTRVALAGSYTYTKGFDIQANGNYGDQPQPDRDGYMSKVLFGMVQHSFSDSFSGFFRSYGYDNRTDYDGYADKGTVVDTRQLYSQTWDTGLKFDRDIFHSQLITSYGHSKDYNFDPRRGRYDSTASLDDIQQYNVQSINHVDVGNGNIGAGVDWQKLTTKPGTNYLADGYRQRSIGVYLTGLQKIGDFTVEGAARNDNNSQFGHHGTWQSSSAWEFIEGYRFVASYGTAFKAPNFSQLYSAWGGNSHLKPEKSKQWEGAFEGLTGIVNWRISGYRNDIENIIDSTSGTGWQYYNIAQARIKGVEATASFNTGPIGHEVGYDYLDARNEETNTVLLRRAKQQIKYQLDLQMTQLDWGLTYHYLGVRHDMDYTTYRPVKMGGVSLWDLAVSYPVTSALTIRGKIANLFDKDYETAYGYQTPGREYYLSGGYTF